MNATDTHARDYAAAVAAIADDIVRQLEDGDAPARRCPVLTAGGYYVETVRVYYADVIGVSIVGAAGGDFAIPSGVARVALDVSRPRRPAHEVRVCFEPPSDAGIHAAADIAAAVLDLLDPTADYAR